MKSFLCLMLVAAPLAAQPSPAESWVPSLAPLIGRPASELRDVVARYSSDRRALGRRYDLQASAMRRTAIANFDRAWLAQVAGIGFDRLSLDGRIDHLLLRNLLNRELAELRRDSVRAVEMAPALPFAEILAGLHEGRRSFVAPDAAGTARTLAGLTRTVDSVRTRLEDSTNTRPPKIVALRATETLVELAGATKRWYEFHAGYDPVFTWWAKQPYEQLAAALERYRKFLREKILGAKDGDDEPIVGDPIGRQALIEDLGFEMIPYGPEELVTIAEREFAWCDAEMLKASRALGFGEDWRAALEKVKTLHGGPGEQPGIVRDLAREAIAFVEQRDLVTVPALAKDVWRMEMMSPERQKVSPFFLGGEVILVSFPTDAMAEADKQMSMRGNNTYFSRATVHHELIPGHHLQGFMAERYQPHRADFRTPFYSEGWSLYWEMLLWDLGFPATPEQKVGMLFWRMHRAARIIFSLKFHLGEMSPAQAVDFLVNRVGHERANATAEVRRSFNGTYSPLYQIAYMMGGLQFRALRQELVDGGKMSIKAFHDAVLQSGNLPVELVRAGLMKQPPRSDFRSSWRFAGL